jgi:hypothetical protein
MYVARHNNPLKHNLALAEAKQIFEETLTTAFGVRPSGTTILTWLSDFSGWQSWPKRTVIVKQLCVMALRIYEESLGATHPQTLPLHLLNLSDPQRVSNL